MKKENIKFDELFNCKRLNTQTMNIFNWIVFIAYMPFGCVLAVSRFILAFLFALITPNKYRYTVLRFIGGFICENKATLTMPSKGALIVSNHSNYLDPIVINSCLDKRSHLGVVVWHGVNFFSKVICGPTVSILNKGNNHNFYDDLNSKMDHHNMIVFPEGAVTDNKNGLLKFQPSIFRLDQPIYLVAIKYHRAFNFLSGKAMSKFMGFEALVDLFQPWIKVELIPIGKLECDSEFNAKQKAENAQKLLANALNLHATNWSKTDRHKRLFSN